MKKVDTVEFWKDRIDTATEEHFSVYVAAQPLWDAINSIHNEIMDKVIPKDAYVLDAGCGFGRWSTKFDKYLGIDFSPDFIEMAKRKFPHKQFEQQNLKSLPYKDNTFDWAIVISIKAMIVNNCGADEWDMMEKELKRVCKKVLILEYGNFADNGGLNDAKKYEVI